MTPLQILLATYHEASQTHREKGTYFEDLICTYLRNEASYRDLYSKVWTYADWAREQGLDARDTGIDLVAQTHGTNEFHAIQCKFYAPDHRIQKKEIDSFFTASGKKPFTHRLIIVTTNHWSEHADDALRDQQPPVSKIDLNDLENSQIDWSRYQPNQPAVFKAKKQLRDHQKKALAKVEQGLQTAARGKLIMACGTGKTFTSLKIAESLAGSGKRVLFLVPSLSLLSQTLTEWTQESAIPLHSFAVCSDSDVGNKRKKDDDIVQTFAHELRYPATTKPDRLAQELGKRHDSHHMSVVFSTYHSIEVISKAQQAHGLAAFDLIICDEAHRTTGATFLDEGEDESSFVKVHDAAFIRASKRLYMTATPRIYADSTKVTAERDNVALCSMDNAALYGQDLYVISFSEAVKQGLLVDYKVLVLSIDEAHISRSLQNLLKDDDNQLKVDDAAKIVGCWKALSKQGTTQDLVDDQAFMRRAVAFCQVIEPAKNPKYHKVSSKNIAAMFQEVVEAYQEHEREQQTEFETPVTLTLSCEAAHVDGGMNASQKEEKLNWLKAETEDNTCRILSNVRCLSEGVDVPALDAVLFLTPRNSQVDVVQSVGRVMRLAPGKKRGYIILPVVIPAGMEPHKALEDNKTYKVVWQVLQALRSHDDRFDAMVNKLDLNGPDTSKMEVIAITDKIAKKAKKPTKKDTGKGKFELGKKPQKLGKGGKGDAESKQVEMTLEVDEIQRAIYAKIVKKVGNRSHWEDWANDIAKIARTHITRIQTILDTPTNTAEIAAFQRFAEELRDDLNNAITDGEIVEMLAQHLITKPVFEALFKDYSFAEHNPMSKAMQDVLEKLEAHRLDKEANTLQGFYDSVKLRAEGIDNAAGKQKIVVELYDKFFRNAFPRMTERLGIVYTPVEVVDFIIHSVNDVLQSEFGQTLGDENVHIIDPFTGTGTFITRLLQSGLITPEQLPYKYQHEIHANEIVLLAYYIAAINIEAVYHDLVGGDYLPFNGICLTDTFQLHEKADLVDELLDVNSARRTRQKGLDIRVIIGNPPYSIGQGSQNDNNQNVGYPHLDSRIEATYAAHSKATLAKGLYDSYIRAIRWASDRIGDSGVMGFVTNAGFIEANTADGLRKCLAEEFSSIYVFHLRGNARTSGEMRRKEKDNVFGQGTRTPIAITLFVKNPTASSHGNIFLHDIGDYLTQAEKLEKISAFASINGIAAADGWQRITPDAHNDWIGQRDNSFSSFISMGDKKDKDAITVFENYSNGVVTSRDAWSYQFSRKNLDFSTREMIDYYNQEVKRYEKACIGLSKEQYPDVNNFINNDATKISWSRAIKKDLSRHVKHVFQGNSIRVSIYRPFTKTWMYFNRQFNEMVLQMPRIFPESTIDNRVICVTGLGTQKVFSTIMSAAVADFQLLANSQCFPLKLYEPSTAAEDSAPQPDLFTPATTTAPTPATPRYTSRDGITDAGLAHFHATYPTETISKEDVFYYIYGLLHSEDYKAKYADNLTKELPRIPCVGQAADFWAFSTAGRELAELHVNYETQAKYPVTLDCGGKKLAELHDKDFYVTKMKFASKADKSTVIYNHAITMKGIPLEAYEYVVNGKPALEWVMERQGVSTHKDSGIVNDANDWAVETMKNARYPLELFQRVITVSLRTMAIVRGLPGLDVYGKGNMAQ
ncbi:DEAD/DEAH box helicase [Thiothrix unzii]|uniref:DEAD/DEAH box helicase n=1 Tax=Thiothrix unzii TaxID=111769 RepID=A0A975F5S5_9GAMM|nr:type ISP restriction/modification enzyme [Thiothrix unzii]QTR51895.1 DEAD/DEAH box helicase [Thiothrix unzii]